MTSVSKNVYIDKFGDIVNKYNNTYNSAIKIKVVNLKSSTYTDSKKEIMAKTINLKLVMLLEYQNTKILLQRDMFEIGLKKFL